MAVDVLHGNTRWARAGQWRGLVVGVLLVGLALAPYPALTPDDAATGAGWGYSIELWWVRVLLLILAVVPLRRALRLRHRPPVPRLEIGPDALRWSDGRRRERTISRAAVRSATCDALWLRFASATDEPIPELNVVAFDRHAIDAALRRHHWPVPR